MNVSYVTYTDKINTEKKNFVIAQNILFDKWNKNRNREKNIYWFHIKFTKINFINIYTATNLNRFVNRENGKTEKKREEYTRWCNRYIQNNVIGT